MKRYYKSIYTLCMQDVFDISHDIEHNFPHNSLFYFFFFIMVELNYKGIIVSIRGGQGGALPPLGISRGGQGGGKKYKC